MKFEIKTAESVHGCLVHNALITGFEDEPAKVCYASEVEKNTIGNELGSHFKEKMIGDRLVLLRFDEFFQDWIGMASIDEEKNQVYCCLNRFSAKEAIALAVWAQRKLK